MRPSKFTPSRAGRRIAGLALICALLCSLGGALLCALGGAGAESVARDITKRRAA